MIPEKDRIRSLRMHSRHSRHTYFDAIFDWIVREPAVETILVNTGLIDVSLIKFDDFDVICSEVSDRMRTSCTRTDPEKSLSG